jgi:hypothetical protein
MLNHLGVDTFGSCLFLVMRNRYRLLNLLALNMPSGDYPAWASDGAVGWEWLCVECGLFASDLRIRGEGRMIRW